MVDAGQSDASLQRECVIYRDISHQDLKNLLAALSRSFSFEAPLQSVEGQQENNKLDPNYFASSFAQSRDFFYFADPFLEERRSDTPPNIISRADVITLLESILKIIEEQKLGNTDAISSFPEGLDLLSRIKKGLDDKRDLLKRDIDEMYGVVDVLEHGAEKEEEAGGVEIGIPLRLKQLIDRPFDLKESWPIVKKLAEDADKTANDSTTISTLIENDQVVLTVIHFRLFINDWLKKLYSDDFKKILESKRIVLPEASQFITSDRFFAYIDREVWNDLDTPIPRFILKELDPVIKEFFEAKEVVIAAYATDSTEGTEGENSVTEKKTKEQLDDLLTKFSNAHASYRQETERLTTILLPQFFAMHSIKKDILELEAIDPANFALVEREFRLELQNVLRSLSPEEFKLLSERGGSLEFRLIVLRKLYGKLSTNPRFVGSLLQYKDKYIEYVEKRIEEGKESQNALDDFERRINLDDAAFEKKLEEDNKRQQTQTGVSWASTAGSLAEFSELRATTQTDLKKFIDLLSAGEKVDYDTLFRNLDVLIAERWSPEQISGLDAVSAYAILGIDLPDSVKNDPYRLRIFFQLCSEFMYARRQRLADHYELDAISRDRANAGSLESLKEAQEIAFKYKDEGGGESLIIARASDSSRIEDYTAGGHHRAATIAAIHQGAREKREEDVKKRQKTVGDLYNAETTIAGKRALLISLGVLSNDIEDVNAPENQQARLLHSLYQEAMGQDYADGMNSLDSMSYFEDQDKDYVQDESGDGGGAGGGGGGRPLPARYGKPGAQSLMKGSLNVRSKYQTAKNRVSSAKKALKTAKKTLDAGKQAVVTVINGKNRAQQGLLALALLSLVQTAQWATQGLGGAVGAVVGAGVGGFVGSYLSPFGTVIGGLGGSFAGARLGHLVDQAIPILRFDQNAFSVNAPSLGAASPLASATAAANNAIGSAKVGLSATQTATSYLAPSAAVVAGSFVFGAMVISNGALLGALAPPPITTVNASGLESKYVTIRKTTTGEVSYPGSVPGQITYQIYIQAKDDFQIDLTNFQDKFTIKVNTEKNTDRPTELSCDSQMNMDTAQVKTFKAEDGEVLLGECTVPLDESYHDSSINNEITIQFTVTQNGQAINNTTPIVDCGENENTFCATSALNVCLGECPTAKQGCWPTTGTLTQPPYGTFSHSAVDAFDIGAPVGTPVYATYPGTAYAFDTYAPEPQNQGLVFRSSTVEGGISRIYGKHVLLVTDQGFVLLYGHMNQHGSTLALGQGVRVTAGTIVGNVGNSGSTAAFPMGYHLHYEYRVPSGGTWHSIIPGAPKDPLSSIVPGPAPGQPFVYSPRLQIKTCYPEGSN